MPWVSPDAWGFFAFMDAVQITGFLSRKIMNKIAEAFLTKSVTADQREQMHILLHQKQKSLKRSNKAFYGLFSKVVVEYSGMM